MSGFLTDLVERTLGLVPVLRARPGSRFEPVTEERLPDGAVPQSPVTPQPEQPAVPHAGDRIGIGPVVRGLRRTASESLQPRPSATGAERGKPRVVRPWQETAAGSDEQERAGAAGATRPPGPGTGAAAGPGGQPPRDGAVPSPPVPVADPGLSVGTYRSAAAGPSREPAGPPLVIETAGAVTERGSASARGGTAPADTRPDHPAPGMPADESVPLRAAPTREAERTAGTGTLPDLHGAVREVLHRRRRPVAEPGPPAPNRISITIGRVEVRTPPAPPPAPAPGPDRRGGRPEPEGAGRPMSLGDYLARRADGGSR